MIHTAKTTRGMIITIKNYELYQNCERRRENDALAAA